MKEARDCACGLNSVRDDAAYWFSRVNDKDLSAAEQVAFDTWLNQHAAHRLEYAMLQQLWSAADLLPSGRLQALCQPNEPTPQNPLFHPPALNSRPIVRYAVAASLVLAAVGVTLFSVLNAPSASYAAQFATAVGERRQVALPDGSVVDLNSRTRLDVRFERGRRSVELTQGEAMFSVAHDASKPFVVRAGAGTVTVTGTRFDVRRDPEQTQVAVESGTVRVNGREGAQGEPVILTAGLGSRIDANGNVTPASAINTAEVTAWRNGKLVFNDVALSDVAAEVSRYREKPLIVAAGKTSALRLTSVFKSDDTDALLAALPKLLPVNVRTLADGSQEIFSR
ncbi:FecR family protein [Pseudomonas sp. NA-150]|uniref:FecR family protein n=1 Tax=Pseudomonas sp. NA-150 TaxID=3367525 RepID=UPI0037CA3A26